MTPEQKTSERADPGSGYGKGPCRRAHPCHPDPGPGNDASFGGLKVVTENGWFAARPSGTENIYKLYAESFKSPSHLEAIIEEAQQIIRKIIQGSSERLSAIVLKETKVFLGLTFSWFEFGFLAARDWGLRWSLMSGKGLFEREGPHFFSLASIKGGRLLLSNDRRPVPPFVIDFQAFPGKLFPVR